MWWAALPLGVIYLILLAHQLDAAIRATNLDADAASGPVIGELFGAAPAHANVVLGEFGWYATLLFDLATKWLPAHRQIWVATPYAMALAGAGLAAWSVWQVAGRWAAGLTAVLLVCASPATLRLDLSTTQHAPAWFCLALLGAFVVWLERRADEVRPVVLMRAGAGDRDDRWRQRQVGSARDHRGAGPIRGGADRRAGEEKRSAHP